MSNATESVGWGTGRAEPEGAMDDVVRSFYLRGDAAALIAIVRRADERQEDDRGAHRALRLLARMGDPEAVEFCHCAGRARSVGAA